MKADFGEAKKERAFKDKTAARIFAAYPTAFRAKLMTLRGIIFDTAATIDGVGAPEETLKWGQPSYLTAETGGGSTIRIDRVKPNDDQIAMYFHCQTDLVETFRELYPALTYSGNRSILFDAASKIPEKALRHCIGLALTYHARKTSSATKTASAKAAVSGRKTFSGNQRQSEIAKTIALRTRRARPS